MNNTQNLFDTLKEAGATRVVIRFDGAGDSGAIEEIIISKNDEPIQVEAELDWSVKKSFFQDGKWVDEIRTTTMSVVTALEIYCYDELEKTGVDWYNNDGGFGEMEIDFTSNPATVKLEVNTRYTEYDRHTYNLTEE